MVANVFRRYHEDDVFGDVGRVVADPLEMAGDQDQIERRLDGRRILQHISQQLAKDLRLQRIQRIVFVEDVLALLATG